MGSGTRVQLLRQCLSEKHSNILTMNPFAFTQPANGHGSPMAIFMFTLYNIIRSNDIFCSVSRNSLHFHLPKNNTEAKHVLLKEKIRPTHPVFKDGLKGKCDIYRNHEEEEYVPATWEVS